MDNIHDTLKIDDRSPVIGVFIFLRYFWNQSSQENVQKISGFLIIAFFLPNRKKFYVNWRL